MKYFKLLMFFIATLAVSLGLTTIYTKSKNQIVLQSLGQAGIKITVGDEVIYIDAFASGVNVRDYEDATMIIVTHADGDHFKSDKVTGVMNETTAVVVANKAAADKLKSKDRVIMLEPKKNKAASTKHNNVTITAYRTQHFVGWNAPNNSYLLEVNGKKIFISGDSYEIDGLEKKIQQADLYIKNTVFRNTEDISSIDTIISERLKLMESGKLFLTHLIGCKWNWNIAPDVIMNYVVQKKYKDVMFHKSVGDKKNF